MKNTFLLAAVTAAALISASGASATTEPLVVAAGGGGAGSRFGCHDACAGGAYIPGAGGGSDGNDGGGDGGGYSGGGGGYGEVGFGGGGGGSYVDASLTFGGSAPGVQSGYGLVDISGASAFTFSYTGSVQDYIVPLSGYYTITAAGAEGGDGGAGHGGPGAEARGSGFFAAGTDLRIVVGGRGNGDFGSLTGGGGGGGSFVYYGAPAAVPEPATWALMISGCGMAGAALRRRRATVAA